MQQTRSDRIWKAGSDSARVNYNLIILRITNNGRRNYHVLSLPNFYHIIIVQYYPKMEVNIIELFVCLFQNTCEVSGPPLVRFNLSTFHFLR